MLSRCNNPRASQYKDYGLRGISVCPEWHFYVDFKTWALSQGYRHGLEIDRERVNEGYSPANCRWVPRVVNARNKTNNRIISAFGESKTLADWADDGRCRVSYHTLKHRLNRGMNSELAITAAAIPPGKYSRSAHDRYI